VSRSAIAGGVIWIGLIAATPLHWARLNTIESLFLLGPLVVVPLGLGLYFRFTGKMQLGIPVRLARKLQLPAALCIIASFWFPQGIVATILVLPWLIFGSLIGLQGLLTLIQRKFAGLRTGCLVVSFLYLPIGCAWLVASRLGLNPMGFQEPIVLLTAVHFHFAGFAAPVLALATGLADEKRNPILQKMFSTIATGVMAGPGLLAIGFVIGPHLKLIAAVLVACSEIGLAFCFLAEVRKVRPWLAQMFITISAVSVLFAMVLAGIWAIGEFPLQPFVHLDEMAKLHGTANALGFVTCGLVGWTLADRHMARLKGDPQ